MKVSANRTMATVLGGLWKGDQTREDVARIIGYVDLDTFCAQLKSTQLAKWVESREVWTLTTLGRKEIKKWLAAP